MITFIILAIVALAWKNGARKRSGQSEIASEAATSAAPKIGRAAGPD